MTLLSMLCKVLSYYQLDILTASFIQQLVQLTSNEPPGRQQWIQTKVGRPFIHILVPILKPNAIYVAERLLKQECPQ